MQIASWSEADSVMAELRIQSGSHKRGATENGNRLKVFFFVQYNGSQWMALRCLPRCQFQTSCGSADDVNRFINSGLFSFVHRVMWTLSKKKKEKLRHIIFRALVCLKVC